MTRKPRAHQSPGGQKKPGAESEASSGRGRRQASGEAEGPAPDDRVPLPALAREEPPPRALWILTALVLLLRLTWIHREGLWLDEVYVYFDAWRPIWRMFTTVHPLHFLVLRAFLSLSDSAWGLRLPEVLWATAAVPVMFLALRRLLDVQAAWLGAAFLALSSFAFNYSLDANYYAALIFWSIVVVWGSVRYLDSAHPVDLFTGLAGIVVSMGFHPFGGVVAPFGVVLVVWAALSKARWMALWPGMWFTRGRPGWAMGVGAVELGAGGLFLLKILPRVRGLLGMVEQRLEAGATFQNLQFGPDFFVEYFRRTLAAFSFPTPFADALGWLAMVLVLVGLLVCLARRPWVGAAALVSIVGAFVLIFNLKAGRFFHIRYLSSLLPILGVLCAAGARYLADSVAVRTPGRADGGDPGRGLAPVRWLSPRRTAAVAVGLFAAGLAFALLRRGGPVSGGAALAWALSGVVLLIAAFGRALAHHVPRPERIAGWVLIAPVLLANAICIGHRLQADRTNWKQVVEALKKEGRPDDSVIYQNFAGFQMLKYYLRLTRLSVREAIPLARDSSLPREHVEELRGLARLLPHGWLIRCWDIDDQPLVAAWAGEHLERVVDAPSAYESIMDVSLYRVAIADRYLSYPYGLSLEYATDEARSMADTNKILWERTVDVDRPGTFGLQVIRPAPGGGATQAEVWLDGRPLGSAATLRATGVHLESGPRRLGLALSDSSVSPPPTVLWNPLTLSSGATFPAYAVTRVFPAFCRIDSYDGETVLRLKRNLGVEYRFDFPETGTYELRIEGVHDKPRSVLLDVALDNQFMGMISFDRADNSWGDQVMPLRVRDPGRHAVHLNLISAGIGTWGLSEDEEINAILRTVQLRRLPGEEKGRDDRIAFGPRQFHTPRMVAFPVVGSDGRILPGWRTAGVMGATRPLPKRPLAWTDDPALEIEVPFDSKGITLLGSVRPCDPQWEVIPVEAALSTFELVNHSVTLGVSFFDANDKLLHDSLTFGQEGITDTTNVCRFAATAIIPPDAVRYGPSIALYENGDRPATDSGWLGIGSVFAGEYE